MASGRLEPKQKGGDIWLQVLSNRGRRVFYGFGSQPRLKTFPFWPRPNMFWSENRCRILKTTVAKAPFCTGVINKNQKKKVF